MKKGKDTAPASGLELWLLRTNNFSLLDLKPGDMLAYDEAKKSLSLTRDGNLIEITEKRPLYHIEVEVKKNKGKVKKVKKFISSVACMVISGSKGCDGYRIVDDYTAKFY